MSRYPGTQFKVYDNSQATAIVPVTNVRVSNAVQYMTTFASVKGPEGITLTSGNDFYDKYGTQDNVIFKKYGQPLFQASMNINNGAALLAKRAVLDDATLGNTTLAVSLTKYRDAKITNDSDLESLISSITFDENRETKYSIAPLMFSIKNTNNYAFSETVLDEYKERYDLYKSYITDVVSNENNPNNAFLSNADFDTKILSGYSQSIYYDAENKIVDVNEVGKTSVRKVVSVTSGIYEGNQKTYSSSFEADDIIDAESKDYVSITNTELICPETKGKWTFVKCVIDYAYKLKDGVTTADGVNAEDADHTIEVDGKWYNSNDVTIDTDNPIGFHWIPFNPTNRTGNLPTDVNYKTLAQYIPISRIVKDEAELNAIPDTSWFVPGYMDEHNEFAMIQGEYTYSAAGSTFTASEYTIDTTQYNDTVRLCNDLMMHKSGYIICEWIFPMFTIFDNGRGESAKSISIEYDSATSVTLKKAIYKLTVYNYATSKKLESFSFSLNPYTRNNNTGYTFDIESTVNYNSNQISVKTYYEAYDALLEVMQEILKTRDDNLIGTYDIIFGHNLNGKYPAFSSYSVSNLLKRYAYIYDYAHLDVFDSDVISVNAYCDSDNMSVQDDTLDIRYYYYNWIRTSQNILERLEFGSNGYCLDRVVPDGDTGNQGKSAFYTKPVVPFLVIDSNDGTDAIPSNTSGEAGIVGALNVDITDITGQTDGTIISDPSGNICFNGKVSSNFATCKIITSPFTKYYIDSSGTVSTAVVYLQPNNKTFAKNDVYMNGVITDGTARDIVEATQSPIYIRVAPIGNTYTYKLVDVKIPYTYDKMYQIHYARFFSGEFDKDIFNLDIYFPNAVFDANYDKPVKLAIQRLAAYRGDFMCYMDMGINKVKSYEDAYNLVPSTLGGLELTEENNEYAYVRDMHVALTCLSYKIRNPYDNRIISVTGTYALSNLYIGHYMNSVGDVFAGISNGITISNIIPGTVSYIPKIYPTSEMTSLNNIGGVYPSEDETIINEKQLMCDLRVNYGCYYDDRFSIETEYTMNPTESEFSYWNNVALVCVMMQSIRKACPAARYQFITADDLTVYKDAVETAMKPWKNKFARITFKYVQDDAALENKIFYAAIEVVFKPFAQAEIFELTALNYSTLSSNVTSV